jgi:hypothetical protein
MVSLFLADGWVVLVREYSRLKIKLLYPAWYTVRKKLHTGGFVGVFVFNLHSLNGKFAS